MRDVKGTLGEESIEMDLWNLYQQRVHGTIKRNMEKNNNKHQVKKAVMATRVEMRKTWSMCQ